MQAPGARSSAIIADINVTPLLDLAWVLLVIFILTTTALVQAIDVKLPEASDHKEEVPTEVVTISIDPEGAVYLNDAPIDVEVLEERLSIFKLANPELPVIVRADRSLRLEQIVPVLDAVKRVPIDNLALATAVQ